MARDEKVSWMTERVVFLLIFTVLTKKQPHERSMSYNCIVLHPFSAIQFYATAGDKTVTSGQFSFHRKSRSPPVNGSFAGEEPPTSLSPPDSQASPNLSYPKISQLRPSISSSKLPELPKCKNSLETLSQLSVSRLFIFPARPYFSGTNIEQDTEGCARTVDKDILQ
ncbi:Hypothetical protein TART1_2854 [Trichococcus shcherbakoviae]|uniref:Uncharacterized protein n=1 Tax=Trichococcus shcherbakoviae TaxID=2094020 RepID=A0A383TIY6_9LACT|nr:Hypothetical protein TART1_2854 [Trichococcus shcherbakoviae]